MTLNSGGGAACGTRRERERRRGSTPWGPAASLHRRSMPVDERDLQAALAPGAAGVTPGAPRPARDWPEGSSDSLSSSDSDESVYKVLLLGAPGVGKSALARIFGGVEDGPEAEAAGEWPRGLLPGTRAAWDQGCLVADVRGSEGVVRISGTSQRGPNGKACGRRNAQNFI